MTRKESCRLRLLSVWMHGWLPLAIACCTLTVLTVQQIDVGRVESKNGHWGILGHEGALSRVVQEQWSNIASVARCKHTYETPSFVTTFLLSATPRAKQAKHVLVFGFRSEI